MSVRQEDLKVLDEAYIARSLLYWTNKVQSISTSMVQSYNLQLFDLVTVPEIIEDPYIIIKQVHRVIRHYTDILLYGSPTVHIRCTCTMDLI